MGILTFVILFGLGMVLFAIQLSPYREPQKVSDQDLINAYLLMGKSGEIKKKCSASFVGANTEINVISNGNPRSIDFIDTLKKLLSPEISVKAIELLQNETIDPGISLIVPSLNPADASYISVEWVKCLYDLGINIKIREIKPSPGLSANFGFALGISIKR